jgi:S-formylglutathione hydrolase FrmB
MMHLDDMKKILLFLTFTLLYSVAHAASVDTARIYSSAMHKEIKCVIIKPDAYQNKNQRFPVVFLLHGYSDRYSNWVRKVPGIKEYADQMQLVIVCPDGGHSSWYFDSPIDSTFRYDTYISREVVKYVDANYRTLADRNHRAITGLSMGGHGALYLALKHPDVFGAAGSMSGGVDLRPFPDEWNIARRIGDAHSHSLNWQKMSVINMIDRKLPQPVAMMIECGTDDFFYPVNKQLHQKMLTLKIPHDYVERPGAHNWEYWENAIEYQLLFFHKFFNGKNGAGK